MNLKDYTIFNDMYKRSCTAGDIAWYIKNVLSKHLVHVHYNDAFISFQLHFALDYVFSGVHSQPDGARYFNADMFSDLGAFFDIM